MKPRILVVDDERFLVNTLQQLLLLDFPEAQVDTACSGEEALSRLASSEYDLIIADLRMPGFDGLELIKGVRYMDPGISIILMTAFGSEAVKKRAVALGVSHYLDKPFDADDILRAVGACLATREVARG